MKKLLVGVCAAVAAAVSFAGSFEVSNDGGESWTAYETLNAAVAAAEDKGIVELTADATWSGEISVENKRVTIRSRGETPFVLTRADTTACFKVQQTDTAIPSDLDFSMAPGDAGGKRYMPRTTVTFARMIVDGGAVWLDKDDPTNVSNGGLEAGGCLATMISDGTSTEWNRKLLAGVTLENGATVRNYATDDKYLLASSAGNASFYMRSGSKVVDCRGKSGLLMGYEHSGAERLEIEGAVSGCYASSTPIFNIRSRQGETFHFFRNATISGNWVGNETDGAVYCYCQMGGKFGIEGATIIDGNFCSADTPCNIRTYNGAANASFEPHKAVVLVGPLTGNAKIGVRTGRLQDFTGVGMAFGIANYIGDDAGEGKIFCDGNPVEGRDLAAEVSAEPEAATGTLVWKDNGAHQDDPAPAKFRYSLDGGQTWQDSSSQFLDDCGGIFGATAAAAEDVGAAEDRIVELLANTKLTKVLGANKSFTLRSGAGGPYKLTINSNASTIDAGFRPYAAVQSEMAVVVSNIVLDGGVFWKNAFDVTKPFADNIASYNPPKGGTVFNTSSYGGALTFGEGAEIRNFSIASGSGFVFAGTGYNNKVVVKPGAVFHDNRGYGPMIEVGASKATYGRADLDFAGEIYNCANAYGDGVGASEKCYGMIATYSANDGSYATAGTAASTVFVTAGGSIHHCQSVYGGGFSFCRIGDRFNSPAVLFKDISITDNRVALGGGAVWAFHMNKLDETSGSGIIRFDGKVTMKDNYQVNFEDGRSVRNSFDNEHYRPYSLSGAAYYQFVRIQPTLDPMSEIGFFAGEYSLETECYTTAIQRDCKAPAYCFASLVGETADTSLLACIKNEIFPELDCTVISSGAAGVDMLNRLSWTRGPGYVAPEEDAAEVYLSDGTFVAAYKTFREALSRATQDKKSTKNGLVVKLLKDGVIGGICPNTTHMITLTSDRPVTVWTHSSALRGDFFGRCDSLTAGLTLAGQVAWRRAVVPDDLGDLLSGLNTETLHLYDQAKVYGKVNLGGSANRLCYVKGSPWLSKSIVTGAQTANLVLEGELTGDLSVDCSSAKAEGQKFAAIAEAYLGSATMSDAHHFKNANDTGLCGGLFDVGGVPTLQWMRCAVTIQDDGTVDTYNYAGDLALGESYVFTVNASADYLNSKVGRKGVYPLIRATSLTGKPTLVLPEGLDYRWVAREVYDGDTLIGYDLVRNGPGLMLFVN